MLADASPGFLELRVDVDAFDFGRALGAGDWHAHFGPATWSVLRLALLVLVHVHVHVHVHDVTDRPRMGGMLVGAPMPSRLSLIARRPVAD